MYEHAQKTHEWSKKRKESYKKKHPTELEDTSTIADSDGETRADACTRDELHPLDLYDYADVPAPQLGGQCRLVRFVSFATTSCPLIFHGLGS